MTEHGDAAMTRFVTCPSCGGDGRDIRSGIVYEPGCGHGHIGDVDCGRCETCKGDRVVEIKVMPIAME
jgi:hypothetical protein